MPRLNPPRIRPHISSRTVARWGTRFALLTLFGLACWLMVGFVRMSWTIHQINQQKAQQVAENDVQRQQNATLKGEAEYRESDVYVEQAAREQLGMARDGETVLLPTVVAPPPTPTPPPVVPQASPDPAAADELPAGTRNYQRWWNALFPSVVTAP